MPDLTCSLCGRVEEVPKWHPQVTQGTGQGDASPYICNTCHDRVRADAARQQGMDPGTRGPS